MAGDATFAVLAATVSLLFMMIVMLRPLGTSLLEPLLSSPPLPNHLIVNRETGQCLDVPYGSLEEGTQVEQCSVNGGPNQFWRLEPVPGDGVRIVNRHSGHGLDIPHGTTEPGVGVEQHSINDGSNQGWRLEPTGDGWLRIVNQHTGLCLEVPSGSLEKRTVIEQAPVAGGLNQHWRTIAVR